MTSRRYTRTELEVFAQLAESGQTLPADVVREIVDELVERRAEVEGARAADARLAVAARWLLVPSIMPYSGGPAREAEQTVRAELRARGLLR